MAKRTKKDESEALDVFLEGMRKRLKRAEDAESKPRVERKEDLKFLAGEQWPDDLRNSRMADQRPCLTINRLPQFVQLIANDQRQNRPDITVDPVADGANEDTAEIIQGLIRHIVYDSRGDTAYDNAFFYATASGLGYMRVITEYESYDTFNQVIKIKQVPNTETVFLDPAHTEPDGSDANWAFVIEDMSLEDYRREYPDSQITQSIGTLTEYITKAPEWIYGDKIRIAEYFEKTYEKKTLYLVDGETVDELPEGKNAEKTRSIQVPKITWYKTNGIEILEKTDWAGQWIPIIPVKGQEVIVDGEKYLFGIIRFDRDVQRRYNYLRSAEIEIIALAPRTPFIAAAGQLDNFKSQWEQANNRNFAYLEYDPLDVDGKPVGPPQRQPFNADTRSIIESTMQCSEEFKSVSGIYDDALGTGQNEKSGRAIMARQNQSHSANFHLVDNLNKSIRHMGRIIVDLIPVIYDTERVISILHLDGTRQNAQINTEHPYKDELSGKTVHHRFDIGRYDVIVHAGPSYATKRQEASAWIQEAVRANPQLMQIAGDILYRNLDLPGAEEISERLKKLLPPQLQDHQDQEVPPQVQGQMQQMQEMIKQLSTALHQAQDKIDTKQVELDSRERIADKEMQVQLALGMAQIDAKQALLDMNTKYKELEFNLKGLQQFHDMNLGLQQAQSQSSQGQPQAPATGAVPPGGQPEANPGEVSQ